MYCTSEQELRYKIRLSCLADKSKFILTPIELLSFVLSFFGFNAIAVAVININW